MDQYKPADPPIWIVSAVAMVCVLAVLVAREIRSRAAVPSGPEVDRPPSAVSPAVVTLLWTGARRLPRAAAAAAVVLQLVESGVVAFDGITSETFVVRRGKQEPRLQSERLVLDALDAELSSRGEVVAPPLWTASGRWWPHFRRSVYRTAHQTGLIERRFPPILAAIVAAALGPFMAEDNPAVRVIGVSCGLLILLLFVALGWTLSRQGQRERAAWMGYRTYLARHADLTLHGPPAVAVWGQHFVYAAAMGLAQRAAELLAPPVPRRVLPITFDSLEIAENLGKVS
jgi:Predicted membrane protein (DUF2207)